jgi:hypothetical protein
MKFKDYLRGRDHFWAMHLTYDGYDGEKLWQYAQQFGIIGLDLWDFNRSWNDQTKAEKLHFYHTVSSIWYSQFEAICNKMEKDDVVVIFQGQSAILGVGRTTRGRGEYGYSPELKTKEFFFDHTRDVIWDRIWNYDDSNKPEVKGLPIFTATLLRAPSGGRYWVALKDLEIG